LIQLQVKTYSYTDKTRLHGLREKPSKEGFVWVATGFNPLIQLQVKTCSYTDKTCLRRLREKPSKEGFVWVASGFNPLIFDVSYG